MLNAKIDGMKMGKNTLQIIITRLCIPIISIYALVTFNVHLVELIKCRCLHPFCLQSDSPMCVVCANSLIIWSA